MSAKNLGFPHLPLEVCLEKANKIYVNDRVNAIDRLSAANHLGYTSLSGASDKMLSTLIHYSLLEKSSKGEVRVTELAQDIFTPVDDAGRLSALRKAATSPQLFNLIDDVFPSPPSETSLKNWLIRNGFVDRVIPSVMKAYFRTEQYLKQEGAFESDSPSDVNDEEPGFNYNYEREPSDMNNTVYTPPATEKGAYIPPQQTIYHAHNILGLFANSFKEKDDDFSILIDGNKLQIHCKNVTYEGIKRLKSELDLFQNILKLREDQEKRLLSDAIDEPKQPAASNPAID